MTTSFQHDNPQIANQPTKGSPYRGVTVSKPQSILPDFGSFPKELTALPIWLGWSYQPVKDGKGNTRWTKAPHGTSTDPATWTTLEGLSKRPGDGVAIALGDRRCGIDIDCAFDGEGKLKPFARDLVEKFGSYTEISPGGDGLHINFYSSENLKLDGVKRGGKAIGWEIGFYTWGRYWCMTGKIFERPTLRTIDAEIVKRFQAELRAGKYDVTKPNGKTEESHEPQPSRQPANGKPDDKLERLLASKPGEYAELGYASDSEADEALCCSLAAHGLKEGHIDTIFRCSGRYREKWDREDYSNRTIRRAVEFVRAKKPDATSDRGRIRSFVDIPDIITMEVPSIEYVVPTLGITRNSITLWTGPDGDGKTYLLEAMAVAIAKGVEFLGMPCQQSHVLYIDLENPAHEVQQRLQKIAGEESIPTLRVWGLWVEQQPPKYQSETLLSIARETKPVIIIDPFRYFHGQEENDSTAMCGVMQYLRNLAALGCAVVIPHHPAKSEGSTGRGSSAIRAACDLAFFQSLDHETGLMTLRVDKNRFGANRTFTIRADFEEGRFDTAEAPYVTKMKQELNQIQAIIRRTPGINQTNIVYQAEMKRAKVLELLTQGVSMGRWVIKNGQRGAKLYFLSVQMTCSPSCSQQESSGTGHVAESTDATPTSSQFPPHREEKREQVDETKDLSRAAADRGDDSGFPRCPNPDCLSYYLWKTNDGDFECQPCGLKPISEAAARRVE